MPDPRRERLPDTFLITFEDRKFSMDDLTLDEVAKLEGLLGIRWPQLRPGGDARHYGYVVATFLLREHSEETVEKILERVMPTVTFGTLRKAVEPVYDDLPGMFTGGLPDDPKEPGTGTSSSSSD